MNNKLFRALCVSALLIPSFALAATPTLYYSLDEGKGTTATPSIGTGQALIQGGAGWVSGKSGTAVGFDGKVGETVALGENILPQGIEGSLSLWVKSNTFTDNNYFFSARSVNDEKTYWSLGVDREGRLVVRYRTGAGAIDQKNEAFAILEKSTWYHIVITANSQKYTYYVNGEEVGSANANIGKWIPDMLTGTLRYTLGSLDAYDHTGVLDGIVDDVRVFGGVLALSDVKALYNETNDKGPSIPAGALPVIQLSLSDKTIPFGGSVSVTWSVTNADGCTASWTTNPVGMSGTAVFTNLATDQGYSLKCVKTGGVESVVGENVHVLAKGELLNTTGAPIVTAVPVTSIVLGGKGPALTRSLAVGARGAEVTLLQQYLITKGFLTASATGYFGSLTQAAVKAFQKANNLDQVGVVGPKTRAKISVTP
jgi:hypothetical protein